MNFRQRIAHWFTGCLPYIKKQLPDYGEIALVKHYTCALCGRWMYRDGDTDTMIDFHSGKVVVTDKRSLWS